MKQRNTIRVLLSSLRAAGFGAGKIKQPLWWKMELETQNNARHLLQKVYIYWVMSQELAIIEPLK
jgi:hypothetical protein